MEQRSPTRENANVFLVAPGVWGKRDVFVNYFFIEDRTSGQWVLVDAGLKWSANAIMSTAAELFGEGRPPAAIILTHGHFDHVGALETLLAHWNVRVYAHEDELPYLTGMSSYPPPDPEVGGGLMSAFSFMYPSGPIDLSANVKRLPFNGSLNELPEWKFIHTPGHAPGHVSLFRERDRVLLAGDAVTTTKAESGLATLFQTQRLCGPPKYFTSNWASAKLSVIKLQALQPEVIASGHGKPMAGAEMRKALQKLASQFDDLAVPDNGRYVNEPAVTNAAGVAFLPVKPRGFPVGLVALSAAVLVAATFVIYRRKSG